MDDKKINNYLHYLVAYESIYDFNKLDDLHLENLSLLLLEYYDYDVDIYDNREINRLTHACFSTYDADKFIALKDYMRNALINYFTKEIYDLFNDYIAQKNLTRYQESNLPRRIDSTNGEVTYGY